MTDGERVVLVFATGDELHRSVRDHIQEWTRQGLLHESIWIETTGGTASGTSIEREASPPIDVAAHLAQKDLAMLRLVTCRIVAGPQEMENLPSGKESFAEQEQYRQFAAGASVRYAAGTLVATLPNVPVPVAVFDSAWQFNLVVVPEDRSCDGRTAVLPSRESLPALTACNLASVAGLWCWASEAVVDTLYPVGGTLDPEIHLVRSLVVAADGGSTFDEIAQIALQLGDRAGSWPLPTETEAKVAEEPAEVVAATVREFCAHFNLRYRPIAKKPMEAPIAMGLWDGVIYFFHRVWEIICSLPARWLRQLRREVEDRVIKVATDLTFRQDSQVLLTLRGHSLPADAGDSTGADRLRELLRVDIPGANLKPIVPEPELWSAFGAIGCGLADAGAFPEGFTAPAQGTTRLLAPWPDFLAPDPDPEFAFRLPGVELAPQDAFGAAELQRCLGDALKLAKGRPATDTASGAARDATVIGDDSEYDAQTRPVDEEETGGSDSDDDDSALAKVADLTRLRDQAEGRFLTAEDFAGQGIDALQRDLNALEAWTCDRHRRESFAWGIGAAIGQGILDASEELASAHDLLRQGPPDSDDEGKPERQRRFRRSAVKLGVVGLILILGIAGVAVVGLLSILLSAVLAALVLLFGSWRFIRHVIDFAMDEARAQFARNRAQSDYYFASERVAHAASATTRLCALYWQYLDWSRMLGHVTRHPRGRPAERCHADAISLTGAPLAITIGTAEMSDDTFQHNVAAGRRVVTLPGWLGAYFARYVSRSEERYRAIEAIPEDESETAEARRDTAPLDMIKDTHARSGEAVYTPRGQARRDIEGDRFAADERAADVQRVLRHLMDRGLEDLFSDIRLPPPAGASAGMRLPEFLLTLVPSEARPPSFFPASAFRIAEATRPNTIWLALPETLTADPPSNCFEATWSLESGGRFIVGAHRVDLRGPLGPGLLSLVQDGSSTSSAVGDANTPSGAAAGDTKLDASRPLI